MKMLITIFTSLLLSSAAAIDCIERLTDNYQRDSHVFTINIDESEATDYGQDKLATSISLVRALLKDLKCSREDVNFGVGPQGRSRNRCKEISPGRRNSSVCYIETNLGFFVVSRNFQTEYHITYNRWD